jgi:hypothetical protein
VSSARRPVSMRLVLLRGGKNNITRLAVTIFLIIAGPQVLSQQAQPDSDGTEIIQGTVINQVTGDSIGRALVYSLDNRFATFTDGQGHFEFTVPKPKESSDSNELFVFGKRPLVMMRGGPLLGLSARKPGFLEDPYPAATAEHGTGLTIRLIPEAIIKGRVVVSDAEAAAGINIELFARQVQDGALRWIRSQNAIANSNGEFRFADLKPGTYKIMTHEMLDTDPVVMAPGAQIYGFPPVCFPAAGDFASGAPIQLAAGQTFQADIPLARQPYFRVQVPVANYASGGGVNVYVEPRGHPGPGYSLGYNSQTQNIEGLLPKGNYVVEATSFGPLSASGSVYLSVTGKSDQNAALALVPGLQIPVNIREEFSSNDWNGSASFNGGSHTVYMRNGPRVYLGVTLQPVGEFAEHGFASLRPPSSPNDNALVIDGAEPGRYWVRVTTARGYVASLSSGGVDLLNEPLTISTGSRAQIDVTVRDDLAKLVATVAGMRNAAIGEDPQSVIELPGPTAYVYWVPLADSSGQFGETLIRSEGQFTVDIAPGTYRIMAFDRPRNSMPYRDAEAMQAYETQGQVVHLVAGQTQHVQLQLITGGN